MPGTERTLVLVKPDGVQRQLVGRIIARYEERGLKLAGLKLVGFAVWERREGPGRSVTFPARQFIVHGDRRNFALLRAIGDPSAQNRVRDLVLRAYDAQAHDAIEAVL